MAELRTCHNPCRNSPPGGEDELARGLPRTPIKGNNTPTPFLPVSRAQTPTFAQAPAPPNNKFSNSA